MTAFNAAVVTLIVALAVIAIAFLVARSRLPQREPGAATTAVYRVRRAYFVALTAVLVVVLGITLTMTPYPARFGAQTPDAQVKVTGAMWYWTLAPTSGAATVSGALVLPAGKLVEFDVSSQDVNHGFGIYSASGQLLAQTQAMPSYTNRLFYRFATPGRYYVLCLEFCGIAHHAMNTQFEVK